MKKEDAPHMPDGDPHSILGIAKDAGEAEVRRAYLEKIRQFPPDRSPEEFERIRDVYTILSDPLQRTRAQLFSVDPEQSLVDLAAHLENKRNFIGPGPWLAAMER